MKKCLPLLFVALISTFSCARKAESITSGISSSGQEVSSKESEMSQFDDSSSIDIDISSPSQPSINSSVDNSEIKTKTVPFFNEKVAVDLSTNSNAFEEVASSFGDILKNMSVDKVYQDNDGVKIGSSKAGGEWILNFKYQIQSVRYTLRPYSKVVNYPSTYVSTDTLEYSINDVAMNIAGSNEGTELAPFLEYSMDVNSNTLDIKTISGRAVFGMMELSYLE
ncbi:MAG: hypothetical protein MJ238_04925 [Bacilli bacterium]|nr:hypothetical protein [Bacilli bacterium]